MARSVAASSGRVMVLGGYHQIGLSSTDLATIELFDPATATWTNGPSAASPRLYPTATILNDGRVLVVSETLSGPQPWTQIYDEQLNSWWLPAQSIDEHATHLAMKLSNDRVLVTGGIPLGKKSEIYNPTANAWTQVAPNKQDKRQSRSSNVTGRRCRDGRRTARRGILSRCKQLDGAGDSNLQARATRDGSLEQRNVRRFRRNANRVRTHLGSRHPAL